MRLLWSEVLTSDASGAQAEARLPTASGGVSELGPPARQGTTHRRTRRPPSGAPGVHLADVACGV